MHVKITTHVKEVDAGKEPMSRSGNNLGDALHVTAQLYNSPPASCIAASFSVSSINPKHETRVVTPRFRIVPLPAALATPGLTSHAHRVPRRHSRSSPARLLPHATQLHYEASGTALDHPP